MIAISLLTLVPGEIGGSETYARSLTRALASSGTLDYRAFVPSLATDAGDGLPSEVVPEYRAARTPAGRIRAMALAAARSQPLRERLRGAEAVHFPLTVPVPPVALPTALTLHDVQHRDLPKLFSAAERAFRSFAYDRAARRADAVIVPSEFVRDRALELLGLDPERVHAVHHGVDRATFFPSPGNRESFLLYPARPWPHKNHGRLFEAFALVRRERPELRLVLTGGGHEGRPLPEAIESCGNLSHHKLVSLYHRAACLVFPSLYEGFGAPPLEAMACGTPVAASDAASLPEICGDAAVLFDPKDPEAIAAGVVEALDRAEELSAAGLARAASFTWEASARGHEAVYIALGAT